MTVMMEGMRALFEAEYHSWQTFVFIMQPLVSRNLSGAWAGLGSRRKLSILSSTTCTTVDLTMNRLSPSSLSVRFVHTTSPVTKSPVHTPSSSSKKLLSRGVGLYGALGKGDLEDADCFEEIEMHGLRPLKVSAGWGHSAVLTECGEVLIFGRPFDFSVLLRLNVFREFLGGGVAKYASAMSRWFVNDKSSGLYASPIPISETTMGKKSNVHDVIDIVASAGLTVGLTKTGQVFALGLNRWGQCGVPSYRAMHHYSPVFLPLPPIAKIDVGLQHAVALSRTGKIFGWGKGNRGQLGDARDVGDKNEHPLRISIKEDVQDISLGFNHSAALTTNGEVLVWGKGMSNERKISKIGAEIYEDQNKPRKVKIPGNKNVVEICSSSFTLVARCEDGSVWALGLGEYDRIAVCDFIPVFAQDSDDQLVLTQDVLLRKGHERVSIIENDKVSQILVHGREAYVKDEFDNLRSARASFDYNAGERMVDLSIGWKHELTIIDCQ